jgi:hypothetical protein
MLGNSARRKLSRAWPVLLVAAVMLQSFSRAYLEAVDQAHLGMSDTVAGSLRSCRWGGTRQ